MTTTRAMHRRRGQPPAEIAISDADPQGRGGEHPQVVARSSSKYFSFAVDSSIEDVVECLVEWMEWSATGIEDAAKKTQYLSTYFSVSPELEGTEEEPSDESDGRSVRRESPSSSSASEHTPDTVAKPTSPDTVAGATEADVVGHADTTTGTPGGVLRGRPHTSKRKSLETEEHENKRAQESAAIVPRKRRRRGFDDKVLRAQTLRIGHQKLLLGTLEEWREVLELTKRRFREELTKKGEVDLEEDAAESVPGAGGEASESLDTREEFIKADLDAEKAVLALCEIFGAAGIRRAWDYLELIREAWEVAEDRATRGEISEAIAPSNAYATPIDQFLAAEEKAHTTRTKAWSAQIMQLLQSVEFIKAYHRLLEDAGRDDSETGREVEQAGLYTGRGRGWASVVLSLLLKKKYGFEVEKGHLKDESTNPEIKRRRKGLQNKIRDGIRVFTYTEYLGMGAVIFSADSTKEKQLFKRMRPGLLEIVAKTIAEVIPACKEATERVFEAILLPAANGQLPKQLASESTRDKGQEQTMMQLLEYKPDSSTSRIVETNDASENGD